MHFSIIDFLIIDFSKSILYPNWFLRILFKSIEIDFEVRENRYSYRKTEKRPKQLPNWSMNDMNLQNLKIPVILKASHQNFILMLHESLNGKHICC